ncbi:uncharacterized protein LOC110237363 [Exaiptasia diaphana]|uniref:Uncharacterized protein n=1 Tax=Exaiptasia diaphana TaxID=2652724 RepID=A0A913X4W1_EXADI|nr:uncharacterized protein LOC110237363 [Exaiptasia diaphana]
MKYPPWWGYGYFLELHNSIFSDVDHQPLNELLSLVKHCASQDEEILKQIDAIKQGQEELKQGQSDLQQGQQEIKQGQSGLQQVQEILKAIKWQDKESISKSCEDVLSYFKTLETLTKVQTEFQPKLLASPDVPSTRTDDIFTNLMIQRERKRLKNFESFSRWEQLQEYNKSSAKNHIDKCHSRRIHQPRS